MTSTPSYLRARLASVSVGLTFIAGCASLPPATGQSYDEVVPQTWAESANFSVVEDFWWNSFSDERLDSLITEAIGENPAIGQAEARLAQARAQAVIAGADRLPQINGQFNGSKQQQSLAGLGPVGELGGANAGGATSFTSENYGLNLNVDWEIDLWGKLAAQDRAAREDYLASADALRATRQSIAAQISKSYFAVIEAEQQVALSQRTVETFTETAREVGNRADVGLIPPNDKLLAESNLQSAIAGLTQREENLSRAKRALQILMRDYPDAELSTSNQLPLVPPTPGAGLPADLLSRRPDIVGSERALRAAGLRTLSAQKSLLPSISLTGSYGRSSSELDNLLDGDFEVWSIAGAILQPIFQGGRLKANIALAEGREKEAAEGYVETVLTAFSEVENALTIEETIARREAALCAAAAAAEESERISLNRYRQGVDPFLKVLESQQRALDSSSSCLSARRARLDNRVDLHLALGGGFTDLNEPPES